MAQTYQCWECIVVDDGSSDAIDELMRFYCEKDSRIGYYQRPFTRPKGANACRNYGFELSKGEYIQWLDSDDLLAQGKIERQVESIVLEDSLSLAICKFGYFSTQVENGRIRENISTYRNFNNGQDLLMGFGKFKEYFPPHVYLTNRELIFKSGLWDESLTINQDGEFYTRILLISSSVKFVNTQVYYRIDGTNTVSKINSSTRAQKLIDSWKLIQSHIQNNTDQKRHPYVVQAKKHLYNRFKIKYPELINENYPFLKSEISLVNRLIIKLF